MKRSFLAGVIAIAVFFHLIPAVDAASDLELHWYCPKKNGELPSDRALIEQYNGYYADLSRTGQGDDRVVYLTFDVGYENGNVAKTLDILRDTDTPAAFFILKHPVVASSDLVLRMANEGHLICNHTANHPNLSHASKEAVEREIRELEEAVLKLTGSETAPYFRPPEGSFSEQMLQSVHSLGYSTVFWSVAYADWDNRRQPSPRTALDTVLSRMHNGAVILLHPTSETNVKILPVLIETLKKEGYRFGTLHELCRKR